VLDLDETLVHSTLGAPPPTSDFAFDVALAGRTHAVHVATRPGLQPFLERCAQLFEVVVDVFDRGARTVKHGVSRDDDVPNTHRPSLMSVA
jgi:TFIIF-interacting CTD phosphatase-like protein